jgi:hypothetical protein
VAVRNPRYQGKPLLRLLECYVLWTINELPEKEADALQAMTPKLRSIFQAEGNWQEVIAAAVKLPATMPAMIRESWHENIEIPQKSDAILTPQQFAEIFVDQNLVT